MNRTLAWGAAVVVAANAVALVGAARNRWGQPEAVLELTEDEAPLAWRGRQDSGLFVNLSWRWTVAPLWVDAAKLVELGFPRASAIPPGRPLSRQGFVALELGPAAREGTAAPFGSRLGMADAGPDPVRLRARHPDTRRTLILRATFNANYDRVTGRLRPGGVHLLNSSVAVPGEYRTLLQPIEPAYHTGQPRYAVTLAAGRNYEPYVVAVRRISPPPPPAAPAP
jgi:hypothetical protein